MDDIVDQMDEENFAAGIRVSSRWADNTLRTITETSAVVRRSRGATRSLSSETWGSSWRTGVVVMKVLRVCERARRD
jgi:hypothetical protein